MAGRDRIAALQRARQRQHKIEEQTARAVRAHRATARAQAARQRAIERADQRVAEATVAATHETARLVSICGSVEAAAEILNLDLREVRRAVSSDDRASIGDAGQAGKSAGQSSTRG
jgi:hypothetical protein